MPRSESLEAQAPGRPGGPADVWLSARGLSKSYGRGPAVVNALSDATLDVRAGELMVILGPSGSGKTTLLNLLGGLERPTAGSLRAFGEPLSEWDEDRLTRYRLEKVGFVFQFFNLVPTLTAQENVALLAELTGPEPEARAEAALAEVGLGDRRDHFPGQLSGGEQQRVAIARGLVKGSPLLLCDEPTGSLDVETGKRVLTVLRDVTRTGGRSVLIVTHNAVIARMAERVVRIRDGRIVADDLNPHPAEPGDLDW